MAFVPAPLPPKTDKALLFDAYAAASYALGTFNAKLAQIPNPALIIRPLQRREALASSAMEGTYTTTDELALLEAGEETSARPETREVQNYFLAITECAQTLERLPISHRMIRQAHARLLGGLPNARGGNKRPGEYKTEQNWIGGRTIEQARFVPPPPQQAMTAMDQLEAYINRPDTSAPLPLIEAGLVHYQFETIHPFGDGNGRVGRILIPILLMARGQIPGPTFYPSAALENQKDDYIDRMFAVSARGAWTEWLTFFLNICSETCTASTALVDKLVSLNASYKEKAMQISRSHNPLTLIDELFSNPVISAPMARDKLGVTLRAARMSIATLEEAEIVQKIPGFNMPEYFVAREIVRIAE